LSDSAIVLLFHGSRAPDAAAFEEVLCDRVRAEGEALCVAPAHLQSEPTLAEALERCRGAGAHLVVVVPMFVVPGAHATLDVARLAAEARRKFPDMEIRVAELLGRHPGVPRAVADLAEGAARPEEPGLAGPDLRRR
jgi:sirohydrochlorin ferrochelatase